MNGSINPHSLACKKLARTAMAQRSHAKEVADAIGKDTSTLSRYLSDEHEHEMGVSSLLIFEALTGDRSLLAYIAGDLGLELKEKAS